jgi:hypothetical protein
MLSVHALKLAPFVDQSDAGNGESRIALGVSGRCALAISGSERRSISPERATPNAESPSACRTTARDEIRLARVVEKTDARKARTITATHRDFPGLPPPAD